MNKIATGKKWQASTTYCTLFEKSNTLVDYRDRSIGMFYYSQIRLKSRCSYYTVVEEVKVFSGGEERRGGG